MCVVSLRVGWGWRIVVLGRRLAVLRGRGCFNQHIVKAP